MPLEAIRTYCKALRLPTIAGAVEDTLMSAQREDWPLETFLQHLLEQEMEGRRERRITRLLKAAHLPLGKTLETFDQQRLPLRGLDVLADLMGEPRGQYHPKDDKRVFLKSRSVIDC